MLKSYGLFWILSINQGSEMTVLLLCLQELVLFYGCLFLKLKKQIFALSSIFISSVILPLLQLKIMNMFMFSWGWCFISLFLCAIASSTVITLYSNGNLSQEGIKICWKDTVHISSSQDICFHGCLHEREWFYY